MNKVEVLPGLDVRMTIITERTNFPENRCYERFRQ